MQEISIAQGSEYKAELMRMRDEEQDAILAQFVAVAFEIQRRDGRDETVEHPW